MATITVSRPAVTVDEVAVALRHHLGSGYEVRMDPATDADRLRAGRGSARVLRAGVTVSHEGDQTSLRVQAGGLGLPLQLINRAWIVPKVAAALQVVPDRPRQNTSPSRPARTPS